MQCNQARAVLGTAAASAREGSQWLPDLCLFQMEEDRPLLFDLGMVTNSVRTLILDAIQRKGPPAAVTGERARAAGQD